VIATESGSVQGLLSFRLNVLSRWRLDSVAIPIARDARLGRHLKRQGVRVFANDILQSVSAETQALIANSSEVVTEEVVGFVLEQSAGESNALENTALLKWFEKEDADWLDRIRRKSERIESAVIRGLVQYNAMQTGQYALAFDSATRHLKRDLTDVFREFCLTMPAPFDNRKRNPSSTKPPRMFVIESVAHSMFLKLPDPAVNGIRQSLGDRAWREEWMRGNSDFWTELEKSNSNQITGRIISRSEYLEALRRLLISAKGIKRWAIELPDASSIPHSEIIDVIGSIKAIDKIYEKDLSEIGRGRSVILTL